MKVEQLMTRPVMSCSPQDSLHRAAQLMWEQDVGCVVVLKEGKVVGVITDRDVCMGGYTKGLPLNRIPVSESMARSPSTVRVDESVATAERLMAEKRIRRLPVVDAKGALVGLLAINDIAREAKRQRGKKLLDVTVEEVVGTLATVSEPRRAAGLVAKA